MRSPPTVYLRALMSAIALSSSKLHPGLGVADPADKRGKLTINGLCTFRTTDPDHREINKVADRFGRAQETLLVHRPDEHMLSRTPPSTGFVYPA